MDALLHVIETYGLWVVFLCVLLDQGGLPVPAYPPMIVTSALAVDTRTPVWPILLVAIAATVAADLLWYAGGRRFGPALLKLMCRISLSPDSCIGRTRRLYGRWGPPSLILAKYIPGFAAVATTLAGETRTSLRRFLAYDAIGAALWAGGAIALGAIFHEAVESVLLELERLGQYALIVLAAALALFVAGKWWQRHRFLASIRMARITPAELTHTARVRAAGRGAGCQDAGTSRADRLDPGQHPRARHRGAHTRSRRGDRRLLRLPERRLRGRHGSQAQGAGLPARAAACRRRRRLAGEGLPIDRAD